MRLDIIFVVYSACSGNVNLCRTRRYIDGLECLSYSSTSFSVIFPLLLSTILSVNFHARDLERNTYAAGACPAMISRGVK